jgi:hypothetical protein
MDTSYFVDEFLTVTPGEPFRLLPFGVLVKNGKKRVITPEYAATFKLPHFRPPLKLGSHKEETPAGGHIVGLEVRDDGLYAVTELNDEGMNAVKRGSYRYHSPEIIWGSDMVENPTTGETNKNPLIWGAALLHTPHLGEAASFYTVELTKERIMSETTVTLPTSLYDRFMALFDRSQSPPPDPVTPATPAVPDEFTAQLQTLQAERDDYAARIATLEAEQTKHARVELFASQLQATPLAQNGDVHTLLANLPDEQAAMIVQEFKALSAQINESQLTGKIGNSHATNDNPVAAFDAAIKAKVAESKIEYAAALQIVAAQHPELYQAYQLAKGGK